MKKQAIILIASIISSATFASGTLNSNSYQELSWKDIKEQTVIKIKTDKISQTANQNYQVNKRLESIEADKRTSFTIKSPRVIDIWVRESYTILENDYIIKNAPVWKKILVKQKNIWEY